MGNKKFSRMQIKMICAIYMVAAHLLFCFFGPQHIMTRAIYTLGEFVPVLFSYFIAEGYILSSNKLRYAVRLLIFGLISQPLYMASIAANRNRLNIILLFSVCVFTLILYNYRLKNTVLYIFRPLILTCILGLIYFCEGDYLFFGIILIFYTAIIKKWSYEKMFLIVGGYYALFYFIFKVFVYPDAFMLIFFEEGLFGILIGYLLLKVHYDKNIWVKSKLAKYSFYILYPVHFIAIAGIHLLQYYGYLPRTVY